MWDGNDELNPAEGRGWAMLEGNEIEGIAMRFGYGTFRSGTSFFWRKYTAFFVRYGGYGMKGGSAENRIIMLTSLSRLSSHWWLK